MGQTGCYSQSLISPYISPNDWCRSINGSEPYCYGDTCVECIDRGCPIERPFCVNFKCVECEEDGNCWEGRTCSPEGKCISPIISCAQADDPDSWCEEHEGLGKCDLAQSKCVECIGDIDCLDSSKPHCYGGECVECEVDAHCGLGYICDNRNECIEGCSDDINCPADKSYCSQKTGKCEECWSPMHCPDGFTCKDYVCVWEGCAKDDSRCPLGYYCLDDACIEGCQNPDNCPGAKPYCSAETGSCEECLINTNCPTDYTCLDFECIHKDKLPEKHPEECEYSGDCGGNWICIYGKCYEGCIGSTFCGSETPNCSFDTTHTIWREGGWGTTYGQCVECTGPEHCDDGYICHKGSCQPNIPEAEWECETDIECDMGVCERFKCVECRGPENCPLGWTCDNNVCVKGCEGPEDCPGDKPICSDALGYCVECTAAPHCPDGYKCDNYHCVWSGCEGDDSLCPLGYYCDVSECVTGCRNNGNCPAGRSHCSQATGDCEECLGTPHCPDGYKCDNYHCVWVGITCGIDSECPKGEWCPSGKCVGGCQNDNNCPGNLSHCSIGLGECVECWSSVHCPPGQKCNDNNQCEELVAVCYDKYDCGFGERCKHGTCIKIECHGKIDCGAGEWCDDGVCKSYTEECGTGCADGYFCNEETNRCERVECKTYKECGPDECCETIGGVNKCVTCKAAKCDALHRCRPGWTCDLLTNLCTEKECSSPAGCPDFYDCIYGICVPQNCANSSAPDAFCKGKMGSDWVCDTAGGVCIQLTCNLLADPDAFCRDTFGPTYICKGTECVEIGYYDFSSPDAYCRAYKGEYWRWNFETETCEMTPCNLYDDPDAMCEATYGEWYRCIGGTCSKSPEGATCHDHPECASGLRCKDGFCHPIECEHPWECGTYETCVNGVCIPLGRDCEHPEDCDPGYFCNTEQRCEKRICENNIDCPLDYCCMYPSGGGTNAETECRPCEEGYCSMPGDCPSGWECNLETKKCERKLCDGPEECGEGYNCVNGYCVAFNCSGADDPLGFCQQWWGEYTYCNMSTGQCEERKCNSYSYPHDICEEQLGEKFKCDWSTGECGYKTVGDYANPDIWCHIMNGSDWWFWDDDLKKCSLPRCDEVYNPDAYCEETAGLGYRCVGTTCKRGLEGDKCVIPEDCSRGFRCKDGICVPTECYTLYQCGTGRWCDKGICRDNDNICVNNNDCRPDYFCHPDSKRCEQRDCIGHHECGEGACCFGGWCIPCEEYPCMPGDCPPPWECIQGYCSIQRCAYDHDCPRGFYCDPETKKCVISYEEELMRSCLFDSDCASDEICVNAGYDWSWKGGRRRYGKCMKRGRKSIKIHGVIDDRTCDYCLGMIGRFFYLDGATLPPYHKHCRCWPEMF